MVIQLECRPGLSEEDVLRLKAGDSVEITGELLTVRDATAQRLADLLRSGASLPVDLRGRVLYAVGPSPARPGYVVGSAGPTTTERLVSFLPLFFREGVRAIIGKGELHGEIVDAFVTHKALYLAAIGGLGALLAKQVTAAEVVAFPELGPEAVFRFTVVNFPAVVVIDAFGRNLHETARQAWRRIPQPSPPAAPGASAGVRG
ncbi:MAG TPA: FumA C-terminus/TtdB family hydratase beta subunit [Limnochordales bacterium]